jgi:hypothetical protein
MTEYNNPATREEKAEALRNEQMLRKQEASKPTSYHRLAGLADDLGGRFAVEAGQSKATDYPRQDSASPWSGGGAQVPPEEPLNFDVTAVEAVGEVWEQQKSIEQGEPTDAATPGKSLPSVKRSLVSARVGSPPPLTGTSAPADDSPAVKPMQAASAPARVGETVPVINSQPDDGLDTSRREDGWPLSSHTIKRRKIGWR